MEEHSLNESVFLKLLSSGNLLTSLCRLCLNINSELFDIDHVFTEFSLNKISTFMDFLHLEECDDKYPKVICRSCAYEITRICTFREKCLNSMGIIDNLYYRIIQPVVSLSDEDGKNQDCLLVVVAEEEDFSQKTLGSDPKCTANDPIICNICSEQFVSNDILQTHLANDHGVESNHLETAENLSKTKYRRRKTPCSHCGQKQYKGFHSKSSSQYECSICKQIYPCKGLYLYHLENIHSDNKLSKEIVTSHRKTFNTKYKPHQVLYKCNICRRPYTTINGLNKHMSSHFNIFECDYCGIKYTLKDNLKRHIVIKHMQINRFFCDVCQKGFFYYPEYVTHQMVHTKEKSFQCHLCGKDFVCKKTLVTHIRLHTGERPYSCSLCKDKFVSASRLNEHVQLRHIGKVKCPDCNKEFTRKESVTKHIKLNRCNKVDINVNTKPQLTPNGVT